MLWLKVGREKLGTMVMGSSSAKNSSCNTQMSMPALCVYHRRLKVHGAWLDSRRKEKIRCWDAFRRSSQMSTLEPHAIAQAILFYASGSNR